MKSTPQSSRYQRARVVASLSVCIAGTLFLWSTSAQAQTLVPSQNSLFFGVTFGDPPQQQTINLASTGGSVSFAAVANVFTPAGANWLSVTPSTASTPSVLTITVNVAGLAPTGQNYQGRIVIIASGATNSPLIIPVDLNVVGDRQLVTNNTSLSLRASAGGSSADQAVVVTSDGFHIGELSFTTSIAVLGGGNWLSVNPSSGTTPRGLGVSANPANLQPGTYAGAITITDTAARSVVVLVSFQVTASGPSLSSYYFAHIAAAEAWRTTFTYVNASAQPVTCNTFFLSDSGNPLALSFGGAAVFSISDTIPAGGMARRQTDLQASSPVVTGWARADCTGPVKASALFRSHNGSVAQAEASVLAMSAPATTFVTYSDQITGLAYANPSISTANVTVTAKNAEGQIIASRIIPLNPGVHGSANVGPLLGIGNFQGSITLSSTMPVVSLALNFEASPVFSTLPPGQPDDSPSGPISYHFAHIAAAEAWRTTFMYVNASAQPVTCNTFFLSDSGNPLPLSFGGAAVFSISDTIPAGGMARRQTDLQTSSPVVTGWARADCTGPVKASALFRSHNGSVAQAEASVLAMSAPATTFVTYSDQITGLAYANPSSTPAVITFVAKNTAGEVIATRVLSLNPGAHGSANMGPLLGIGNFQGSITLSSTVPVVSLALNFEASPVFSTLPPGQ